VSVIFATNGDYKGRETGAIRAQESIKALSRIGITKGDIYFMGYADTGMRPTRSFFIQAVPSRNRATPLCALWQQHLPSIRRTNGPPLVSWIRNSLHQRVFLPGYKTTHPIPSSRTVTDSFQP